MKPGPRIGISANFMHADDQRPLFRGKTLQYFEERMALSVHRAGAVPLVLADLKDAGAARAMVQSIDGLVLTGGADVSPLSYGHEPLKDAWSGDKVRDDYERELIEVAVDQRKPVLGICRGIQILNVALGGTLWQDITTQVDGSLVHRDWHRYDDNGHEIRLEADSWVSEIYGGVERLAVNSIHHQGLRDLAPGLVATAWASDEIIEAVEWTRDDRWIKGVQWHPEWLESEHVARKGRADGDVVFAAFARACGARNG